MRQTKSWPCGGLNIKTNVNRNRFTKARRRLGLKMFRGFPHLKLDVSEEISALLSPFHCAYRRMKLENPNPIKIRERFGICSMVTVSPLILRGIRMLLSFT